MKTPKFKIHYNRELNQKFYSEKDYTAAMKQAGVEPYRPDQVKKNEPKPYERSEWAKEMQRDIKNRNGSPPGDRFIKELDKRGFNQKRYDEARRIANASS